MVRSDGVLLTGRLTRDPEMRVVTNGKNVTQFQLEYSRARVVQHR
jgi:single-stranded DNA-binding protein